jgi:hypothetical protein
MACKVTLKESLAVTLLFVVSEAGHKKKWDKVSLCWRQHGQVAGVPYNLLAS